MVTEAGTTMATCQGWGWVHWGSKSSNSPFLQGHWAMLNTGHLVTAYLHPASYHAYLIVLPHRRRQHIINKFIYGEHHARDTVQCHVKVSWAISYVASTKVCNVLTHDHIATSKQISLTTLHPETPRVSHTALPPAHHHPPSPCTHWTFTPSSPPRHTHAMWIVYSYIYTWRCQLLCLKNYYGALVQARHAPCWWPGAHWCLLRIPHACMMYLYAAASMNEGVEDS